MKAKQASLTTLLHIPVRQIRRGLHRQRAGGGRARARAGAGRRARPLRLHVAAAVRSSPRPAAAQ